MQFLDDSLLPETQDKLVITVAPYAPRMGCRATCRKTFRVTMEEQVQKAVDCYNAGATVLHIHVRELDGKGSKRLSKFNEMLDRLREAVPDMILQVGGSISFAPEGEGAEAKWLSDDTRHMLAELTPQARPGDHRDQHDADEHHGPDHRRGICAGPASWASPTIDHAYREMFVPVRPGMGRRSIFEAAGRGRHPAALHDRLDAGPGDGRAAGPRAAITMGPL